MSYTAKVIAVLGRTLRAGRWKLADESLVIAVFGRCVLDLSRAYVDDEDDELSMSVLCLFGSVSIVLPPGCDVEPSGIAFLASSEVEIPSDKADDITHEVLAPLDISWFAMFGRVRINEIPSEVPQPAQTTRAGAAEAALAPPDNKVFGTAPASSPSSAQAAEMRAEAPVASTTDADEDALRNEIAQWRSETGRPVPEPAPEPEPTPEETATDSDIEQAAAS